MYKVLKPIRALQNGRNYGPGETLYGNEFPAHAYGNMLSDGVIALADDVSQREPAQEQDIASVETPVEDVESETEQPRRGRKKRSDD